MKQTKTSFKPYLRQLASYLLLTAFFLPCFLLDLFMFFLSDKGGCINCGIKEIIKQGIFTKIIIKKAKNE